MQPAKTAKPAAVPAPGDGPGEVRLPPGVQPRPRWASRRLVGDPSHLGGALIQGTIEAVVGEAITQDMAHGHHQTEGVGCMCLNQGHGEEGLGGIQTLNSGLHCEVLQSRTHFHEWHMHLQVFSQRPLEVFGEILNLAWYPKVHHPIGFITP